jgi:hypothetical protein
MPMPFRQSAHDRPCSSSIRSQLIWGDDDEIDRLRDGVELNQSRQSMKIVINARIAAQMVPDDQGEASVCQVTQQHSPLDVDDVDGDDKVKLA